MGARRKKGRFNYPILFSVILLLVIIATGIFIFRGYMQSKVDKWQNKIYPSVFVDGIDLSGKTKEQAVKVLKENHSESISDKEITIIVNDKEYKYKYSDISAEYDVDGVVDKIFDYGKNLSVKKQYGIISKKKKVDYKLDLHYDKEKLALLEEKIKEDTKIAAKDATILINMGKINIEESKPGYEINLESLHNKLIKSLDGDLKKNTKIKADLVEVKARITKKDLQAIKETPMSTYTTDFSGSTYERANNVKLATSLLNGTILMPGDIYSYSEMTQKGRGQYLDAPVYVNNQVELAEAGGICQVSSTLYNAVIRANIRSVERINHSLPVSYVPLGLDATMSWGYLDYKFKNTYDFPIYIAASSDNGQVSISVYGDPSALNGIKYDFVNEIVETINPKVEYINDDTLLEGTEVIESQGQTGYKVKSYLVGYKNGLEVSRELIATDTYATTSTKIKKGTKKADNIEQQKDEIKEPEKDNQNNDVKNEEDKEDTKEQEKTEEV